MRLNWGFGKLHLLSLLAAFLFCGLTACDDESKDAASSRENPEIAGVLIVSDGEEGNLRVINLQDGSLTGSFDIASPASIYRTSGLLYGAAIQTDEGVVNFIDAGVQVEDHGDHVHVHIGTPMILDFGLVGTRPIHFVSHGGWSAIHFDGNRDEGINARVVAVNEDTMHQSNPNMLTFEISGTQHGAAVPAEHGKFIITEPNPAFVAGVPDASSLPVGVKVYSQSGTMLQDFTDTEHIDKSCIGLHGEAATGDYYAFGCDVGDGVLILKENNNTGEFSSQKVPYPDDSHRTGTLIAHESSKFFVGNFGNEALMRINPENSETKLLSFTDSQCGFVFGNEEGTQIAVLTIDGSLHQVGLDPWVILDSLNITSPFECSGVRPNIAAGPGLVYLTEPETGRIIEIKLDGLEILREFEVGGTPLGLTALAMIIEQHED